MKVFLALFLASYLNIAAANSKYGASQSHLVSWNKMYSSCSCKIFQILVKMPSSGNPFSFCNVDW